MKDQRVHGAEEQRQLQTVIDDRPTGYPHKTMDEVIDSAPRGLPRPLLDGLPHPYIANLHDLADADAFRRAACIVMRLCQVCGLALGDTATVCWRPGDWMVVDGAAIHPTECWNLAKVKCPELGRMIAADNLRCAEVPTASLEILSGEYAVGIPVAYGVPKNVHAERP